MTLEQFIEDLKELMRSAEDKGLDPDQLCEVAEFVLSDGWHK